MFNRNGLTDEENDLKSLSGVVDSRVFQDEPKSMKHSELLELFRSKLTKEEFDLVTKIGKSSTSGMNYLSVKFGSEEDLDNVIQNFPRAHKCMKRYGWGFLVNEYLFKNYNKLIITDSYKFSHKN